MRNTKLTLFIFLISSLSLVAQPTIDIAIVPTIGTATSFYKAGDHKLFTPGVAGTNVSWNFTNLDTTLGSHNTAAKLPSNTPFAVNFPSSCNYAVEFDDIFGSEYLYTKLDNSNWESYGTMNAIYSNPEKLMSFPFQYNSFFKDTFNDADGDFRGFKNVKADAYGTLTLPTGVFNNVLRVNSTDTLIEITLRGFNNVPEDSIFFEGQSYTWYSPTHSAPILDFRRVISFYYAPNGARVNVDTTGYVRLSKKRIINGLNDFNDLTLNVYPNPVTSFMKIESALYFDRIEVYDLSGRKLRIHNLTDNYGIVYLGDLSNGIYRCKLIYENGEISDFKISIQH